MRGCAVVVVFAVLVAARGGAAQASVGSATGLPVDRLGTAVVPPTGVCPLPATLVGQAVVYSSVNVAPLYTYTGSNAAPGLGSTVGSAGDVDGDGLNDFAVGDGVTLTVYSGATGGALYAVPGGVYEPLGDVDLDGTPDFAVGPPAGGTAMSVRSGTNGAALATIAAPVGSTAFLAPLALTEVTTDDLITSLGDLDGNGSTEIVVGSPLDGGGAGRHDVFSIFAAGSAMGPCAVGTVGTTLGGPPEGVLTVNGSAGGATRTVVVGRGRPLAFAVAPPSATVGTAPFAILGRIGAAGPLETFATAVGPLCFIPSPAAPANPFYFVLATSLGTPNPPAILPSTAAPWSATSPSGIPFAAQFTLQGVIASAGTFEITNALVVDIR